MGEFSPRRPRNYNMQAFVLASMMVTLASSAPSAEPEANPGYGFYGHHVSHGPPCKPAYVEETKEVCHIEPEKVCDTKTRTYKVVTGYEDGECKEIEVCKFPHHKRRRSAEPEPHYGVKFIECEKETKEVCKKEPVVEEKSKDFELCHLEPKKVCEEKTFKIPTLHCEEEVRPRSRGRLGSANVERNVIKVCHF